MLDVARLDGALIVALLPPEDLADAMLLVQVELEVLLAHQLLRADLNPSGTILCN